MAPLPLRVGDRVAAALADRRPVVALESTVLTHGLPAPDNAEIGLALEAAVRAGGAEPATVGVVGGALVVGLDDLDRVKLVEHRSPDKVSRANLAFALATGATGGTTVSATLIAAAAAGIRLFATGGIGGVHRGWVGRPDISADLGELARAPVAVVSAGPKAVLDLAATAEVLEALGVPMLGYGTDRMPAFWLAASAERVTGRVDSPDAAAAVLAVQFALPCPTGALVMNPIPADAGLDDALIDDALAAAERDAHAAGVTGPSLTPYLLAHVARTTGGRSVTANRALLLANARVAAEIAAALCRLGDPTEPG